MIIDNDDGIIFRILYTFHPDLFVIDRPDSENVDVIGEPHKV